MVVNHVWFLLQKMGLVESHRISYDWQQVPGTWINHPTILWFWLIMSTLF